MKELPLFFQDQYIKSQQKTQNIFKKVEIINESEEFSGSFPDNFFICN